MGIRNKLTIKINLPMKHTNGNKDEIAIKVKIRITNRKIRCYINVMLCYIN